MAVILRNAIYFDVSHDRVSVDYEMKIVIAAIKHADGGYSLMVTSYPFRCQGLDDCRSLMSLWHLY